MYRLNIPTHDCGYILGQLILAIPCTNRISLDMVLRTTRQTICTDVCSLGVESAKQNGGDEHIIINNTTYE